MNELPQKKLKPVVFIQGEMPNYFKQNTYQQKLLLKAMMVSNNKVDWKKMIGVRQVADVERTLDKLMNRRDWHAALANHQFTVEGIASGLRNLCDTTENDTVKLGIYKMILTSIGLDKYEDIDSGNKSWEDLIVNPEEKLNDNVIEGEIVDDDYDVSQPVVPEEVKKRMKENNEIGKSIYE